MTRGPMVPLTFLFTDIQGSTRLWEEQPEAMRLALIRHDRLLESAVSARGGRVLKHTGDGICAEFEGGQAALEAAVAAQIALLNSSEAEGLRLLVRMAVHTGPVEAYGRDYMGPTLNRVARLLGAAHGGQILLSDAAAAAVCERFPHGARLRDLGAHRLRDLSRPQQIFQVVHPELPDDFPSLRTLSASAHNLPASVNSFVGREEALSTVQALLGETRLLTLTGIGGCGKTRLAVEAAEELLGHFPDGVWLIELDALNRPELVVQSVAEALGVVEVPGSSLGETLRQQLHKQQVLLLLDNCEHMIAECARLVEDLLRSCPKVRVLATSREPLSVAGEVVWPVPPLMLPSQAAVPTEDPRAFLYGFGATRLFLERAVSSRPGYQPSVRDAEAIVQLCRRLDGLPLAIELAAPWVRTLNASQIAQRLNDRFRLLTQGRRTALPRQQTLRGAIDWSYELLEEPERILLQRLAVFAGRWTLESAEHVCALSPLGELEILDLLQRLVDKSLIQLDPADDIPGFRYLESVRQYAREKLELSGEATELTERHRRWYRALSEQAETELRSGNQSWWLARLEAEHDDLRATLAAAIGSSAPEVAEEGLELAASLWMFWYVRGHYSEGRGWLEQALAACTTSAVALRGKALNVAGILARTTGDRDASQRFFRESLELRRDCGDRSGVANVLNNLAILACDARDYASARSLYLQSVEIYRELGDLSRAASALSNLASAAMETRSLEDAEAHFSQARALFQTLGDQWGEATVLLNLAYLDLRNETFGRAGERFRDALQRFYSLGDRRIVANCFYGLAQVSCAREAWHRAALLLLTTLHLQETLNVGCTAHEAAEHDALRSRIVENLGEAEWANASARSAQRSLDEMIHVALSSDA